MTKGVWGIGLASFLADVGHEVPTALFASLVIVTLGAPAAMLGLIEGLIIWQGWHVLLEERSQTMLLADVPLCKEYYFLPYKKEQLNKVTQ